MAAGLLVLGPARAAQAQSVQLHGPPMPKGTVVEAVSVFTLEADGAYGDETVPISRVSRTVSRSEVVRADARAVRAVRQIVLADTTWERFADEPLTVEVGVLQGLAVKSERGASGRWTLRADGWTPTEAQAAALAETGVESGEELPHKAVQVGETVEVPRAVIARVYDGLVPDEPAWMAVRLDSVGVQAGHPVAYLSEAAVVTVSLDGGAWMEMDMTAQVIRRLDVDLPVRVAWEGEVWIAGLDVEMEIAGWMTIVEDYAVVDGSLVP